MTVFYRVHWSDAPAFNAANAYSALWGAARSKDGSQTECALCDATGKYTRGCPRCDDSGYDDSSCQRCEGSGFIDECEPCDGTGWQDCVRGYSCFADPDDLISYFTERARSGLADGEQVIVFEGQRIATGCDGEPTAVPTRVIEALTWEEFVARHQEVDPTTARATQQ